MAVTVDRVRAAPLHPAHAFFLAAMVPLFVGALLSDLAYWSSYQVQWINFASWLIAGGLVVGAVVLVLALLGLSYAVRRERRYLIYCLLVLAIWVLGFLNALIHSRDAWASMPTGLVLSIIVVMLAGAAAWLGFAGVRTGATP